MLREQEGVLQAHRQAGDALVQHPLQQPQKTLDLLALSTVFVVLVTCKVVMSQL